jgi:hypothetical protein
MSMGWVRSLILIFPLLSVLSGPLARPVRAQAPTASTDSVDAGWPRQLLSGTTTFSVYQPQVDSWTGNQLAVRAAVAVQEGGAAEPAYGVIWLSARTDVDKTTRIVSLTYQQITKANFPSAPDSGAGWQARLQGLLPQAFDSIALDRLESGLAIHQEIQHGRAQPLRNAPPRVIFSSVPAILVPIDSQPVLRPAGNGVQRVINTRPLLLEAQGTFYLHVFDGWMRADALTGPWTVAKSPPAALASAMQAAVAANEVDLLTGTSPDSTGAVGSIYPDSSLSDSAGPPPSLAEGPVPAIYVSTQPAELVVTEGAPDYVPIAGTQLLYVRNTTGRVFKSIADNDTYVLISGRWYRAPSTNGPWTYVPGKQLPADFAQIPDSSPMENVKASVPGTPQAREAAIANSIPQTATVQRAGTTLNPAPTIDGAPEYRPIEGTKLSYVMNASLPIIEAGPTAFYSVQNGVWFVATSVGGPWSVAASVPAEIYAIPPSSPLHYVTFVQVYGATPDVVYVGYTPGYYGTVLDPDGVVVYGTGYDYAPWIGTDWFGSPYTYGFGAGMRWTPWTGWGFGFGLGWSWGIGLGMAWGGWGWGPHPWWGPSAWGWGRHFHGDFGYHRGGWAGTTGNVYARWGRGHLAGRAPMRVEAWHGGLRGAHVGVAYNSHTGMVGSGQRVPVRNISGFNHTVIGHTGMPRAGGLDGRVGGPGAALGRGAPGVSGRVEGPGAVQGRGAPGGIGRPAPVAAPQAFHPAAPAPAVHVGGAARGGNDVFASPGGQVFRGSSAQGFQQRIGNGWQGAGAAPRPMLQQESQGRAIGAQRTEGFRSIGGFHGGGGGFHGGGGGFHGGGSRH